MGKKKPSIQHAKFTNLTWHFVVFVRVGGTLEQAEDWFAKKFDEPPFGVSETSQCSKARCMFVEGEASHMIWFEDTPGGGIAAHEAFHSACHVLRTKGLETFDFGSEEAWAYLIQWVVSKIGERFW